MATVKFSGELREQIVNMAKSKFQAAVTAANETHPRDWGMRLYNIILGPHLAIMQQLPSEYFSKTNVIEVHSIGNERVGLSYALPGALIFPEQFPQGHVARKYSSYTAALVLKDIAELADFKEEVIAWKKRVHAAQERQKEFAESVSKVINAYATLAPALKAWPPLWDLVPEPVKERHKLVVEREKKAVEINVDLDRMTALASFTKIRNNQ